MSLLMKIYSCRYCTSLSSGRFSCCDPHWYYNEVTEQGPFTFSVILPVACPYKREITVILCTIF